MSCWYIAWQFSALILLPPGCCHFGICRLWCMSGYKLHDSDNQGDCRSTSKNNVSLHPPEISIYEALLRLESRQFLREMNATQDYSYLDTPRSSAPIRQAS